MAFRPVEVSQVDEDRALTVEGLTGRAPEWAVDGIGWLERDLIGRSLMRAIWVLGLMTAGCMTDPGGDSCVWSPGNDGYCPTSSSGGSSSREKPPEYHKYANPRFVKVLDELFVIASSHEKDVEDYEEITLADGARRELGIAAHRAPAIACDGMCVAGWRQPDGPVLIRIRTVGGWSSSSVLPNVWRAPAVAVFGDVILAASSRWVGTEGETIELWRLNVASEVVSKWTLAVGAGNGHLSLTVNADGGVATWSRVSQPMGTQGTRQRFVVAQLLGRDGAPTGAPFEYLVTASDEIDLDDYYRAAPAALIDGAYRVAPRAGGTWLVIDPRTRTITARSIGELTSRTIQKIVPDADGALVSVSDNDGGAVLRVVDDQIVGEALTHDEDWGAPDVALTADGLRVAFAARGSMYVADWQRDFELIGEPTPIAERYEVGGCSAGGSSDAGSLALVAIAGVIVVVSSYRRRRVKGSAERCVRS